MDKLDSLRAFTRVVKDGSFAAAARSMNLSRSVVNRAVINLEKDLTAEYAPGDTHRNWLGFPRALPTNPG